MDIDKVFLDHLMETYSRLTNIRRYNTEFCNNPENVATHSFFVAYTTMFLCDHYREIIPVNTERALRIALLHDVEESISGDLIPMLKKIDPEVEKAIAKINYEIVDRIIFPLGAYKEYVDLWSDSKGGGIESGIVSVADVICSLMFTHIEYRLGNYRMGVVYGRNLATLKSIDASFSGVFGDLVKLFSRLQEEH